MTGDDGGESGLGGGLRANRRDFMKVGGLATGGLLGATGLGRAADLGALGPLDLETDLEPGELAGTVLTFLDYGASGIAGDSPVQTIGGVDVSATSALWAVDWGVGAAGGPARRSGRTTVDDVVVAKRVDRASPHLYERVQSGERLAGARVLLFDVDPSSGATRHYFTLALEGAEVGGVELAALPVASGVGHLELVGLAPERTTVRHELEGVETVVG